MITLEDKIEGEIIPLVQELGCEVVRVALFPNRRNKVLQIMIERIDGSSANIDDCQKISKSLSLKLDVMNVITDHYNLEVSSAGIDRPLVKPKDFVRFCHSHVVVKTRVAKFGCKNFKGNLEFASENGIKLRLDVPLQGNENEISFLYEEISSAHIDGNKK